MLSITEQAVEAAIRLRSGLDEDKEECGLRIKVEGGGLESVAKEAGIAARVMSIQKRTCALMNVFAAFRRFAHTRFS